MVSQIHQESHKSVHRSIQESSKLGSGMEPDSFPCERLGVFFSNLGRHLKSNEVRRDSEVSNGVCLGVGGSVLWSAASVVCHLNCIEQPGPESFQKGCQNQLNFIQNPSKMVPRNAPKGNLGASQFHASQRVTAANRKGCHFGATCAILGAIWDPAGRRGFPKSTILAPGCAKMSKNEVQNEASKKI